MPEQHGKRSDDLFRKTRSIGSSTPFEVTHRMKRLETRSKLKLGQTSVNRREMRRSHHKTSHLPKSFIELFKYDQTFDRFILAERRRISSLLYIDPIQFDLLLMVLFSIISSTIAWLTSLLNYIWALFVSALPK